MPRRSKRQVARVSLRALAAQLHVSHTAVRKAIANGRLLKSIGRDARGPYVLDLVAAEREWSAGAAKPPNNGGAPEGPGSETLVEAQRRVALQRAARLELANRRDRGELLSADVVLREQFEAARVVRDAMLNLPDRVAAELASEHSPQRVHARLTREIRRALESVAEILERE